MHVQSPAYLEIVDFFAGTNPEAVIEFHPSSAAQQRLSHLVEREKAGGLSLDEKAELDHFIELEHLLRMAKAKAREILARAK
ncbi:MAG TPA: hypothetical protein VFB63_11265 [Bryobacteraceae bacterium]|nr:hypothetical protein [Bryobacteraceae bacterium]